MHFHCSSFMGLMPAFQDFRRQRYWKACCDSPQAPRFCARMFCCSYAHTALQLLIYLSIFPTATCRLARGRKGVLPMNSLCLLLGSLLSVCQFVLLCPLAVLAMFSDCLALCSWAGSSSEKHQGSEEGKNQDVSPLPLPLPPPWLQLWPRPCVAPTSPGRFRTLLLDRVRRP